MTCHECPSWHVTCVTRGRCILCCPTGCHYPDKDGLSPLNTQRAITWGHLINKDSHEDTVKRKQKNPGDELQLTFEKSQNSITETLSDDSQYCYDLTWLFALQWTQEFKVFFTCFSYYILKCIFVIIIFYLILVITGGGHGVTLAHCQGLINGKCHSSSCQNILNWYKCRGWEHHTHLLPIIIIYFHRNK